MIKVKGYRRKGKPVSGHTRRKRPKGKKRFYTKVGKQLYSVKDENGRWLGYSKKKR